MRTFLALDIPLLNTINELYNNLQKNLSGVNIKYTHPNQGHITLSFLGETSSDLLSDIHNDLSALKLGFNNIELNLKGLGVFKDINHPQVLWVGLNLPLNLETLHKKINQITQKYGFANEYKSFSPHYTVGRIKYTSNQHNLKEFLDKYQSTDFGNIEINKFVFYESVLKPEGPIYNILHEYKLH